MKIYTLTPTTKRVCMKESISSKSVAVYILNKQIPRELWKSILRVLSVHKLRSYASKIHVFLPVLRLNIGPWKPANYAGIRRFRKPTCQPRAKPEKSAEGRTTKPLRNVARKHNANHGRQVIHLGTLREKKRQLGEVSLLRGEKVDLHRIPRLWAPPARQPTTSWRS